MTFLPSVPGDTGLSDVFRAHPQLARPLLEASEAILRGSSPLSAAERELIGAYVSGLNDCAYCRGVHTATAEAFGVAEATLVALLDDVDSAPVDDKLKPLLRYLRKLTLTPSRMSEADAAEVFAAGWDENALHSAVSVCALFNFMNRYVEGLGVASSPQGWAEAGVRIAEHGYLGGRDFLG